MRPIGLLLNNLAMAGGARVDYTQKVLAIDPDHLVGYWSLNETEGTVALDASGNDFHGSYTGVELNSAPGPSPSMGRAGFWDGANDYCNLFSAGLGAAFNATQGWWHVWAKLGPGAWTDGAMRIMATMLFDNADHLKFGKWSDANSVVLSRRVGGVSSGIAGAVEPTSDWFVMDMTWDSIASKEVRLYVAGANLLSRVYSTAISSPLSALLIGADTVEPAGVHSGWLMGAGLWSAAGTPERIAALALP